jgi:hypothetical protein
MQAKHETGGGMITSCGIHDFLHNVPTRSGRKSFMMKNAACHNRSGDTGGAPTSHFGESKK